MDLTPFVLRPSTALARLHKTGLVEGTGTRRHRAQTVSWTAAKLAAKVKALKTAFERAKRSDDTVTATNARELKRQADFIVADDARIAEQQAEAHGAVGSAAPTGSGRSAYAGLHRGMARRKEGLPTLNQMQAAHAKQHPRDAEVRAILLALDAAAKLIATLSSPARLRDGKSSCPEAPAPGLNTHTPPQAQPTPFPSLP